MKYSIKHTSIIIWLTFLTLNSNILSQNSDTTFLPSIGKHIFTSITGVDDPFINTKFLLQFGSASLVETEIPITFEKLNRTINFKPEIFYAQGGFEFQYAVRHWAAIKIKAAGFASLGDNTLSLVSQGIDAATIFGIGWLVKIAEDENFLLSTAIDLNSSSLTFIDIASSDSAGNSADSLLSRQFISNYQSLTSNLEFRLAVKLSKVVGVITKVSGGFGEVYASNSTSSFKWNTGFLLSLDLRNWFDIPFGVAIGATAVSSEWRYKDAKPPVYSANLNIAYINRNDFTVGIENYLQSLVVKQTDNTLNFLNTRIYMSYFF